MGIRAWDNTLYTVPSVPKHARLVPDTSGVFDSTYTQPHHCPKPTLAPSPFSLPPSDLATQFAIRDL